MAAGRRRLRRRHTAAARRRGERQLGGDERARRGGSRTRRTTGLVRIVTVRAVAAGAVCKRQRSHVPFDALDQHGGVVPLAERNRTWQEASIERFGGSSGRSRCSAKRASIGSRWTFPAHAQGSTARLSPRRGQSTPRGGTAIPSALSTESERRHSRSIQGDGRRRSHRAGCHRGRSRVPAARFSAQSGASRGRWHVGGAPGVRRVFRLGGNDGDPSPGTSGRGIGLPRGVENGEFAGTQVALGNLEARIPLGWPQRGWGTWPIFYRNMHATAFADVGNAWRDPAAAAARRSALAASSRRTSWCLRGAADLDGRRGLGARRRRRRARSAKRLFQGRTVGLKKRLQTSGMVSLQRIKLFLRIRCVRRGRELVRHAFEGLPRLGRLPRREVGLTELQEIASTGKSPLASSERSRSVAIAASYFLSCTSRCASASLAIRPYSLTVGVDEF